MEISPEDPKHSWLHATFDILFNAMGNLIFKHSSTLQFSSQNQHTHETRHSLTFNNNTVFVDTRNLYKNAFTSKQPVFNREKV
jgi:hypothetical protein